MSEISVGRTYGKPVVVAQGVGSTGALGLTNTVADSVYSPMLVDTSAVTFTVIAAGGDNTFWVDEDGLVYSAGESTRGALGQGTPLNTAFDPTPLTTSGASIDGANIVSISVGYRFTLMRDSTGDMHSVGSDEFGQLGNAAPNDGADSKLTALVDLTGLSPVQRQIISFSAGYQHAIGCNSQGDVVVWGKGTGNAADSPLGAIATASLAVPTIVASGSLATASCNRVVAGRDVSMVIDSNDQVHVFGSNAYGALGMASTGTPTILATGDMATAAVRDVALSQVNGYALSKDGRTVYCWGANGDGQCGQCDSPNPPDVVTSPVEVSSSKNSALFDASISGIVAGGTDETGFAYALLDDGRVAAWGHGSSGQLGTGASHRPAAQVCPTFVDLKSAAVTELSAGFEHGAFLVATPDQSIDEGGIAVGDPVDDAGYYIRSFVDYTFDVINHLEPLNTTVLVIVSQDLDTNTAPLLDSDGDGVYETVCIVDNDIFTDRFACHDVELAGYGNAVSLSVKVTLSDEPADEDDVVFTISIDEFGYPSAETPSISVLTNALIEFTSATPDISRLFSGNILSFTLVATNLGTGPVTGLNVTFSNEVLVDSLAADAPYIDIDNDGEYDFECLEIETGTLNCPKLQLSPGPDSTTVFKIKTQLAYDFVGQTNMLFTLSADGEPHVRSIDFFVEQGDVSFAYITADDPFKYAGNTATFEIGIASDLLADTTMELLIERSLDIDEDIVPTIRAADDNDDVQLSCITGRDEFVCNILDTHPVKAQTTSVFFVELTIDTDAVGTFTVSFEGRGVYGDPIAFNNEIDVQPIGNEIQMDSVTTPTPFINAGALVEFYVTFYNGAPGEVRDLEMGVELDDVAMDTDYPLEFASDEDDVYRDCVRQTASLYTCSPISVSGSGAYTSYYVRWMSPVDHEGAVVSEITLYSTGSPHKVSPRVVVNPAKVYFESLVPDATEKLSGQVVTYQASVVNTDTAQSGLKLIIPLENFSFEEMQPRLDLNGSGDYDTVCTNKGREIECSGIDLAGTATTTFGLAVGIPFEVAGLFDLQMTLQSSPSSFARDRSVDVTPSYFYMEELSRVIDEDSSSIVGSVDVNSAPEALYVTMSVSHGVLSLLEDTGVVTPQDGWTLNDQAIITFSVEVDDLSSAFAAIEYLPAADYFGDDSIVIDTTLFSDATTQNALQRTTVAVEILPINDLAVIETNEIELDESFLTSKETPFPFDEIVLSDVDASGPVAVNVSAGLGVVSLPTAVVSDTGVTYHFDSINKVAVITGAIGDVAEAVLGLEYSNDFVSKLTDTIALAVYDVDSVQSSKVSISISVLTCAAGFYVDNEECRPCPAGTAAGENGLAYCRACAGGTAATLTGQQSCATCPVGTFSLDPVCDEPQGCIGPSVCSLCSIGSFQNSTGSNACMLCEPGYASSTEGATQCSACAPGSAVAIDGATACNLCTPGTHASFNASTTCEPCSPGSFSDRDGEADCQLCALGEFSPSFGSTACSTCEQNTFADEAGLEQCKTCVAEVEGDSGTMFRGSTAVSDCVCLSGSYGRPGGPCTECPSGGVCELGNNTLPYAQPGFWQESASSVLFYECIPADACPGGQLSNLESGSSVVKAPNSADGCAEGYQGFRCGECYSDEDVRYYRLEDECRQCPAGGQSWTILVFFVLLFFGVGFMILAGAGGGAGLGSMKIFVDFAQVTSMFMKFNLDWPPILVEILSALSIFNLNIEVLRPDCDVQMGYYTRLGFILALPIIVGITFIVMLCALLLFVVTRRNRKLAKMAEEEVDVSDEDEVNKDDAVLTDLAEKEVDKADDGRLVAKDSKSHWKAGAYAATVAGSGTFAVVVANQEKENEERKRKQPIGPVQVKRMGTNGFMLFLSTAYAMLAAVILEYFDCTKQVDGQYLMDGYPTQPCYDDDWMAHLWMPITAGVIYVVGIPVIFMAILFANRHQRHADNYDPLLLAKYSTLISNYEPEYMWWQMMILARKLALIAVLLMTNNALTQAVGSLAFLLFGIVVHVFARPFSDNYNDQAEFASLLGSFVVLFFGLAMTQNEPTDSHRTYFTIFVIIILLICGIVLLAAVMRESSFKVYDFFNRKIRGVRHDDLIPGDVYKIACLSFTVPMDKSRLKRTVYSCFTSVEDRVGAMNRLNRLGPREQHFFTVGFEAEGQPIFERLLGEASAAQAVRLAAKGGIELADGEPQVTPIGRPRTADEVDHSGPPRWPRSGKHPSVKVPGDVPLEELPGAIASPVSASTPDMEAGFSAAFANSETTTVSPHGADGIRSDNSVPASPRHRPPVRNDDESSSAMPGLHPSLVEAKRESGAED